MSAAVRCEGACSNVQGDIRGGSRADYYWPKDSPRYGHRLGFIDLIVEQIRTCDASHKSRHINRGIILRLKLLIRL